MRIVHWCANFLWGGSVSRAVLGLAASQARLGAAVAIVAARPSGAPLYGPMDVSDGVIVFEWQPRWSLRFDRFRLRGVPSSVSRYLRAFGPEVVHVHGGFNPDNWWAPRLFECPVVFSPHGAYFPSVFLKGRRVAKNLYMRVERRALLQHVRAVHALSPIERASIRPWLPGCQMYCLPQGPGIRMPLAMAHEAPDRGERVVTFVHVGRLDVFNKGLDILLEAFAEAEKRLEGQPIRLTLVGADSRGGRAWLRRRSRELDVADRVVFAGVLSDSEVVSTLHRSHVYVQASRYEAFGLSAAEALLVGTPTILSDAVGLASYPEIAALPHVRVVPVNVAETAAAMADVVRRLDDLSKAAGHYRAEVAKFFSWESVAKSQVEMYRKIRMGVRGDLIA